MVPLVLIQSVDINAIVRDNSREKTVTKASASEVVNIPVSGKPIIKGRIIKGLSIDKFGKG